MVSADNLGVPMRNLPLTARLYVSCIILLGTVSLVLGLPSWRSDDPIGFAAYFFVAMVSACMKVSLPTIRGTMSVNFLIILAAISEFSLGESLLLGCCSFVLQYLWNTKERRSLAKVAFNTGNGALSIWVTYTFFYGRALTELPFDLPLRLTLMTCVFFAVNTGLIAGIISLTEQKSLGAVWKDCYVWSFPYYLVGAAIVGIMNMVSHYAGWQMSILAFPAIYLIYRSYRLYLERLAAEKRHAAEVAELHLRTIEALASAIEAKDETTHDHLQRVQTYAIEIGKELGISGPELEALRAASLLHDIGKLAVPENIINKPARLTPEEFEKVKIHPIVGGEILQRVRFPYPVVPIVCAHHEKWDGSGYPYGLKGEEIPIGARILSAVDCLDALASDRQYRRAIPLDEAMNVVASEAGKSYDPRVVEVLGRRYCELEKKARQNCGSRSAISTGFRVARGLAPAAGFENISGPDCPRTIDKPANFLSSIAEARHEVQFLFDISQALGNSLSLDETLSVLAVRLNRIVPFDAMAVYVRQGDKLVSQFSTGDDFRLFSSLEIPAGQGISGWVGSTGKPIINGNPSVEAGYLKDPAKLSSLRSALAVPLEGVNAAIGVLTLYRAEKDAFTADHLRILLAINSKVGLSIENSLRYREAKDSATIDYLTGLPNARSLFVHLQEQIERCVRHELPLTVLVGDLNGFKEVNDRLGHLEGNRLLRELATGLRQRCREQDYLARMGGDEFVVVLPGCSSEMARDMATRLCEVAVEAGHRVAKQVHLSMSVGWADMPSHGCSVEEILSAADQQMYSVKQAHKNRRRVIPIGVAV
jgi:diguanylate cyclase (GGDEF)-like protein/putative nucleotidyltransferase with HDIG domain